MSLMIQRMRTIRLRSFGEELQRGQMEHLQALGFGDHV